MTRRERRKTVRELWRQPLHRWKRASIHLMEIRFRNGVATLNAESYRRRHSTVILRLNGQLVSPAEALFNYVCGRWSWWRLFKLRWKLWWSNSDCWTHDQWNSRCLRSKLGEDTVELTRQVCHLDHEQCNLTLGGVRLSKTEGALFRHIKRKKRT